MSVQKSGGESVLRYKDKVYKKHNFLELASPYHLSHSQWKGLLTMMAITAITSPSASHCSIVAHYQLLLSLNVCQTVIIAANVEISCIRLKRQHVRCHHHLFKQHSLWNCLCPFRFSLTNSCQIFEHLWPIMCQISSSNIISYCLEYAILSSPLLVLVRDQKSGPPPFLMPCCIGCSEINKINRHPICSHSPHLRKKDLSRKRL